jgi:hypothetical protein
MSWDMARLPMQHIHYRDIYGKIYLRNFVFPAKQAKNTPISTGMPQMLETRIKPPTFLPGTDLLIAD